MSDVLGRARGCVLGAALGDALGAPHEGGWAERLVWRMLTAGSRELRWTDDTQMAIDVAESWLAHGEFDGGDLVARFASSYRWSRGYGPSTARAMKRVRRGMSWQRAARVVHPDGSFGNGAAMRSHIIGLVARDWSVARRRALANKVAATTHAHPDGAFGAQLVAEIVAAACQGEPPDRWWTRGIALDPAAAYADRLLAARDAAGGEDIRWVRQTLGNGMRAVESVVTAIYLAAGHVPLRDFDGLMDRVRAVGGDVDTIGAMAGGLFGAAYGVDSLPKARLERLEARARLTDIADALVLELDRMP